MESRSMTTSSLGNTNSGLGNIVLGGFSSDFVLATWLGNNIPGETSAFIFRDEDGNKFTMYQNIPTILSREQLELAESQGARFAVVGAS
jgi:hypothetical protein